MLSNERQPLLEPVEPVDDNGLAYDDQSYSSRLPIGSMYSSNHIINIPNSDESEWSASVSRYRYYNRLGMPPMPDHIIPAKYFVLLPVSKGSQGSIITIFAIWNTMMGTSLLSISWVIQQAGFGLGVVLMLLVAALSFYTVYLVLKSTDDIAIEPGRTKMTLDFTDACKFYLGRRAEIVAIFFSVLALLGALIVFYVILCDFLYSLVTFIYDVSIHNFDSVHVVTSLNRKFDDVLCPAMPLYPTHNASYGVYESLMTMGSGYFAAPIVTNGSTSSLFIRLWSKHSTVPIWILIIIFPLVSIKSPDFFTKFNTLGTISVGYLILLVILKLVKWGVHMDFSSTDYNTMVPNAKVTFPALTGCGSLAFFIHNGIHSIVRNQRNPQNNMRDISIAYALVATTYLFVGIVFYISYPFAKDCIEQNFLNNLSTHDALAFVGRIALLFQIITVFPLLMYILRAQFMYFFFKRFYPSWLHVFLLHSVLLILCILFATFMPNIGEIARFSGALCGLFYMIALPCLVKIKSMKVDTLRSKLSVAFHALLILLGVLNFFGQFVPFFMSH